MFILLMFAYFTALIVVLGIGKLVLQLAWWVIDGLLTKLATGDWPEKEPNSNHGR